MNAKKVVHKITMPNGDFVLVGLNMHTGDILYEQKRDNTEGQKLFIL